MMDVAEVQTCIACWNSRSSRMPGRGAFGKGTRRKPRTCGENSSVKSTGCLIRDWVCCLEIGSYEKFLVGDGSRGGQHG